jgi:SET domain-containing protein
MKRSSRFAVKRSSINGRGLFANRNFKPGEEILIWRKNLSSVIFINHSCLPSCTTLEPQKRHWELDILIAGENGIKRGQELTFDYRVTRWNKLWNRTIAKKCGCPKHK